MFARLILVLVTLLALVAGVNRSGRAEAASGSREGAAWLRSHGLFEVLLSRIEAARYAVRVSAEPGSRGHEAGNPAQGLRARFEGGIAVAPPAPEIEDWR
jgi:hypothetical protein